MEYVPYVWMTAPGESPVAELVGREDLSRCFSPQRVWLAGRATGKGVHTCKNGSYVDILGAFNF